jgi:uncharacterized RDD family membrane protein YckC
MNEALVSRLIELGPTLVVTFLVLSHYQDTSVPSTNRYSTFAPRFWAAFVDGCVLWPVGFIAATILYLETPRLLAAVALFVEGFAWIVYTVLMHARYGQTLGKMGTKVRVVDVRTEGKITLRQAWLREAIPAVLALGLVGCQLFTLAMSEVPPSAIGKGEDLLGDASLWVLSLPLFWYLAELLTMLTNKKRRALHDFIAGTVVIRTNM